MKNRTVGSIRVMRRSLKVFSIAMLQAITISPMWLVAMYLMAQSNKSINCIHWTGFV